MPEADTRDHLSIAEFAEELAATGELEHHPSEAGDNPKQGQSYKNRIEGPNTDIVLRIPVTIKVILGSKTMSISELANLAHGQIVSLDRRIGDKVEISINGRVIALGELALLEEEPPRFAVTVTDVSS